MGTKVRPLNGYTGYTYEQFTNSGIITRADTLPFSFKFREKDQITPIDVTGYIIVLSFATSLSCLASGDLALEVELTPQDAVNGIISGEISDDETFSLPVGQIFSSAKYIKSDGRSYIFDMAKLEVAACVSNRRA